jgi:hypothetical protein
MFQDGKRHCPNCARMLMIRPAAGTNLHGSRHHWSDVRFRDVTELPGSLYRVAELFGHAGRSIDGADKNLFNRHQPGS